MEGRPEAPEPYYPPTYAPEPVAPQPIAPRPKWKSALGVLGAIGLVILKFGAKLKAVLLLLPKLKLFTTSASMLVSIGAYALLWGWKFGVGLVLLLLVHELGHVWQARREGLDASAPLFIPFLGAAIALKELPKDAAVEARVGLAGPIIGSLGTCVPLAIWLATGEEFWQALAFFGFFLNLLNLAPVLPLDGGRAMAALTPWMWIVGYAMLVAATIAFPNPIMILILIFGGLETWRRWKERKSPERAALLRGAAEHARRRGGHLHRPSPGPRRRHGGHLPRAGLRRRVTGRAAPPGAPGCSRRTGRRASPRPLGRPRSRPAR